MLVVRFIYFIFTFDDFCSNFSLPFFFSSFSSLGLISSNIHTIGCSQSISKAFEVVKVSINCYNTLITAADCSTLVKLTNIDGLVEVKGTSLTAPSPVATDILFISKQLLPVKQVTRLSVTMTATAESTYNHPGLIFNCINENNYDVVFARMWTAQLTNDNGLFVHHRKLVNGVFHHVQSGVHPVKSLTNRVLEVSLSPTQRDFLVDGLLLFTVSGNFVNDVPRVGLFSGIRTSLDSTSFSNFMYNGIDQPFGKFADFRFYNYPLTPKEIQNQLPLCEKCAAGKFQDYETCSFCPRGKYGNTTGLQSNYVYEKHKYGCSSRNEICNRYELPCRTAASRFEVRFWSLLSSLSFFFILYQCLMFN